jgi:hypothetical protein
MGYLKRVKWIRDEIFVSGRGECVCEDIGGPCGGHRVCDLGEDDRLSTLRFLLGVERTGLNGTSPGRGIHK